MNIPYITDIKNISIEKWSYVATIFATLFTAIWAIKQWRDETARRREDQKMEREVRRNELAHQKQELRWKQAELARQLLDDIFDYKPSDVAWRIVDGETKFKVKKNEVEITMNDVRRALHIVQNDDGQATLQENQVPEIQRKDDYICWCFDALFYYMERLEQSCEIKVVCFDDLLNSASYYIKFMARDKQLFESYAKFIQLERAVIFMRRFPVWQTTAN